MIKNPFVKKLSAFYIMIGSLTWVPVISLNMLHLSDFHFSPIEIGVAIGAGRIINSVLLFGLLKKSNFFTRKRTFILLPVILIFSYIPAIFVSKWFAILPVIGSMFVSSARWNILSRYTNAEFDSKSRATAISTLCMAIGIIYVIIMSFAGVIMERFGGSKTIFTGMGLLALVFALPLGLHLSKHHAN